MSGNLAGLFGEDGQQKMAEEARGGFTVLPAGWYDVVIKTTELKDTRSGTGKYLQVNMTTTNGDDLVDRFNIKNDNEQAEKIGRGQLAKLGVESGIENLTDSLQLHGMSVCAKVDVQEFESNKEAGKMLKSNNVTSYRKTGAGSNETADSGSKW